MTTRDDMMMKPPGMPMFAIGNAESRDFYYYDEGPSEGMILAFRSKEEAEEFIRVNDLQDEAFVVDLSGAGTKVH